MTYYVTTDTHFGHDAIIGYCDRPVDFSERIISNWKKTVGPDDWVIHLGDVSWPKYYETLKELPGHKILVKGNHDRKSDNWYRNHGFDVVCTEIAMKLEGMDVVFTHQPLVFHNHDINIHGHLHGLAEVESECAAYCVSLERLGYRVIPLSEILKYAKQRLTEFENKD